VRHPLGCCIILDNASIHRRVVLRALAAAFGVNVRIIFLPAYSPELNPVRARASGSEGRAGSRSHAQIELLFGWMKCSVRRGNVTPANLVSSVLARASARPTPRTASVISSHARTPPGFAAAPANMADNWATFCGYV